MEDQLTEKLIELIEQGQGAATEYAPILTEKLIRYTMVEAWVSLALSAAMMICAFYSIKHGRRLLPLGTVYNMTSECGGVLCFVGGVLILIGALLANHSVPIILEPAGYLVSRFVR